MTILVPDLKPLSAGQILDRGIRLYRNNFLTFIGIIAIMQIPLVIVTLIFDLSLLGELPGIAVISGIIIIIISAFLTQFGTAAITLAVSDNYLGNPITIIGAYKQVRQTWWTLLGATFLLGLLLIAVLLICFVPFALIQICGWIPAVPGIGLFAFFAYVVLPLIAPVVVLEGQRATSSIYRSWHLARRRFWWILGFFLLLALFNFLIVEGPTQVITFLLNFAISMELSAELIVLLPQITSTILSIIYLPLEMACITLLYFDLRVRTEGLDLAILASADSAEKIDSNLSALNAPEPNKGFEFTGRELGYFCLITVGAVLVFGALALVFGGLFAVIAGAL